MRLCVGLAPDVCVLTKIRRWIAKVVFFRQFFLFSVFILCRCFIYICLGCCRFCQSKKSSFGTKKNQFLRIFSPRKTVEQAFPMLCDIVIICVEMQSSIQPTTNLGIGWCSFFLTKPAIFTRFFTRRMVKRNTHYHPTS